MTKPVLDPGLESEIKNVEVNYRGIFQKTLARSICKPIIYAAKRQGKVGFSYGRYSDAPERNGVPCKYFAVVGAMSEEDLEAEAAAKVEPDSVDVSIVVDDTMVKGVEPWAHHGIRPINEKVKPGGTLLVVSERKADKLVNFVAKTPFSYKIAVLSGKNSFSGLWVYRNDLTDVRCLGALAKVEPDIVSFASLSNVISEQLGADKVATMKDAYNNVAIRQVGSRDGVEWPHDVPVLPKWNEFSEGIVVKAIERNGRNPNHQRWTTRTMRPVIRFDMCVKCDLCWYACPDECFDATPEGYFDVTYDYCVGCGRCAEVCPVPECIVMVDELGFENNERPYPQYKQNREAYTKWVEEKKGKVRVIYPFITGTGLKIEPADPSEISRSKPLE